jgi:hypothetical protein
MTDVPFLGFSLAAIYLMLRGFDRGSKWAMAGGLALALAATLVRQLGLAPMVGFAAAVLVRGWRRPRQWLTALAPLLVGFASLRIYEAWLDARGALPGAYHHQWMTIVERVEGGLAEFTMFWLTNVRNVAIEVGLHVAPLAAIWLFGSWTRRRARRPIVLGVATVAAAWLAWRGRLFPYFSNLVLDVGCSRPRWSVGPLTLRDGCLTPEPGLGLLGTAPRFLLTWIGLIGAGCVVIAAVELCRDALAPREADDARGSRLPSITLVLATAASYLAVVASIDVFDRYLLFLVPFAALLLAAAVRLQPEPVRAPAWALAGALTLASLLWSVGAVQEYLDWNRARWRAIAFLANEAGAGREEIDGGFEYGGWVNFDARFRHDRRASSWWWVVDDRYAVAFAPIEGYVVLEQFPYRGWFGLVENDIVALGRMGAGAPPRRQ